MYRILIAWREWNELENFLVEGGILQREVYCAITRAPRERKRSTKMCWKFAADEEKKNKKLKKCEKFSYFFLLFRPRRAMLCASPFSAFFLCSILRHLILKYLSRKLKKKKTRHESGRRARNVLLLFPLNWMNFFFLHKAARRREAK